MKNREIMNHSRELTEVLGSIAGIFAVSKTQIIEWYLAGEMTSSYSKVLKELWPAEPEVKESPWKW